MLLNLTFWYNHRCQPENRNRVPGTSTPEPRNPIGDGRFEQTGAPDVYKRDKHHTERGRQKKSRLRHRGPGRHDQLEET